MKVTIEPSVDPRQEKINLTFFVVALGTGITLTLLATAFEHIEQLWWLSSLLVFVVGLISLTILGMSVAVAREQSLRRLTVIGFLTLAAPWCKLVLFELCKCAGGHDAGMFSLVPYMWSCTIAGLGLLVTASVRFVRQRRKPSP